MNIDTARQVAFATAVKGEWYHRQGPPRHQDRSCIGGANRRARQDAPSTLLTLHLQARRSGHLLLVVGVKTPSYIPAGARLRPAHLQGRGCHRRAQPGQSRHLAAQLQAGTSCAEPGGLTPAPTPAPPPGHTQSTHLVYTTKETPARVED